MVKVSKKKLGFRDIIKVGVTDPNSFVQTIEQDAIDIFPIAAPLFNLYGYLVANPYFIKQLATLPNMESPFIRTILKKVYGDYSPIAIDNQQIWRSDRDIYETLFHQNVLKRYEARMLQTILAENEILKQHAEQGTAFNLDHYLTKLMLNILGNTIFGGSAVDLQPVAWLNRELFRLARPSPLVQIYGIPMPLYFKYVKYKKQLRSIVDSLIKEAFVGHVNTEDHLVICLAKAYGYQSYETLPEEIKEHIANIVTEFLSGGHEPGNMPLAYLLITICLYPLLREKICEEIHAVLGSREPTYDDLMKLTYLKAAVKESLRLFPAGYVKSRALLQEGEIEELIIKKNNTIIIHAYACHRHPLYWNDPISFDPSRFLRPLTEEQASLYLPFGIKPHSCIGAQLAMSELMLIVVMILKHYRLALTAGSALEPFRKFSRQGSNVTMKVTKL
jgi:cytochrome P450